MKRIKMGNKPYVNTIINKFLYCTCSFLANAFITRALGTQLKGEYTWLLNYANIFATVAGLGVYQSIPYYTRKEERDWTQEYVNIFTFQTIIYSLILFIIIGFNQSNKNIIIIGILCVVDIFSKQLEMLLLVDKIYKRNSIFFTGAVLNLILSIFFFVFGKGKINIAIGLFFTIKVFYILAYLIAIKKIPQPWAVSINSIADKVKFGYIPMFSLLLITLNYRVDVLMLKADPGVGGVELSLYTVGVTIAEIAWVIPDAFKEVLFSRTSNKKNDQEVAAALRVSNFIIILTIIGVLLFGKIMIYICFGVEFIDAYAVTILLFLGIPSMSWFKIIYTLFNAMGKRRTSFSVLLGSTLLNIFLNYILIPYWGIYGAAMASVFSYGLCGIIFLVLYSRITQNSLSSLFVMRKEDLRNLIGGKH